MSHSSSRYASDAPASDKQIAANRLNARQSTGPNTDAGAVNSSFNALRHGLYARDVVLPGEDRAAFDELLDNLRTDLNPQGRVEEGLIQRAADIWWRLGRTAAIEAGLLNPNWSGDPRARRLVTANEPLIDGFRVAIDETKVLDRLGRYEGRLERGLARTLGLLKRMQDARLNAARAHARKVEP